jgi:hypothetical protein
MSGVPGARECRRLGFAIGVVALAASCSILNEPIQQDGGNPSCSPSCLGNVCGADGCGGSCGSCLGDSTCQGGQCVAMTVSCEDDGDGGNTNTDTACPSGSSCLCEPLGSQCVIYSAISLSTCYLYQDPDGSPQGFCTTPCLPCSCDPGFCYQQCPETLFGQTMTCYPVLPPNTVAKCFPGMTGYAGADLMPNRCGSDADCAGTFASP